MALLVFGQWIFDAKLQSCVVEPVPGRMLGEWGVVARVAAIAGTPFKEACIDGDASLVAFEHQGKMRAGSAYVFDVRYEQGDCVVQMIGTGELRS